MLIAAHSLGCLAVAWWAKERWSLSYQDRVIGALLVGVGSRLALVTEPRVAILPVREPELTERKLEPLRDHARAS